jgi:hypothetical protein
MDTWYIAIGHERIYLLDCVDCSGKTKLDCLDCSGKTELLCDNEVFERE